MSSYGVHGYSQTGEHATTANQKAAWAQQQAAAQQQEEVNWNRGREGFERSLLSEEQARKKYDSETARQVGSQKYSMLGGLLDGLVKQNSGGGGGYMAYSAMGGVMPRGGFAASRSAPKRFGGSGQMPQG